MNYIGKGEDVAMRFISLILILKLKKREKGGPKTILNIKKS